MQGWRVATREARVVQCNLRERTRRLRLFHSKACMMKGGTRSSHVSTQGLAAPHQRFMRRPVFLLEQLMAQSRHIRSAATHHQQRMLQLVLVIKARLMQQLVKGAVQMQRISAATHHQQRMLQLVLVKKARLKQHLVKGTVQMQHISAATHYLLQMQQLVLVRRTRLVQQLVKGAVNMQHIINAATHHQLRRRQLVLV